MLIWQVALKIATLQAAILFIFVKISFYEVLKTINSSTFKHWSRVSGFFASFILELIWLQAFLKELDNFLHKSPVLWYDNIDATYLSVNSIFNACTKRVAIVFHFIHECVTHWQLDVHFIFGKTQLADVFTKALVAL